MTRLLVFTDLDGTLLDHDTYSFAPALPALTQLDRSGIPLIFNSSKTAREISVLRRELNNRHPYIVENGGAVCIPQDYFSSPARPLADPGHEITTHELGPRQASILPLLRTLREAQGYRFRGFTEMTDEEVAELTGLSLEQSGWARQRHCSEPLLWQDTEAALAALREQLVQHHLQAVRGGRFVHVMGRTDKAIAMQWLLERYQRTWPEHTWVTVALGDSANDVAMLEAADIAVVIPAAHGTPLSINKTGRVINPGAKGPQGWHDAMAEILRAFN